MNNKKDIKAWLDQYNISGYTINEDLTVDVEGSVDLYGKELTSIPVQFGYVSESFNCGHNQLTSFQGCPKKIGKDFFGLWNNVTSLENGPKEIGNDYCISNNPLKNLLNGPKIVGNDFLCRQVPLKNLHEINTQFNGSLIYCGAIIEEFSQFYQSTSLIISSQNFKAIKGFLELNDKVPQKNDDEKNNVKRKI